MTTRRLMGRGAAAVAGAALVWGAAAGCAGHPKSPTQHPQPVPSAQQEPAEPKPHNDSEHKVDQMEASAGSADALARKAEAYSRELSPLMNQRAASQAAGAQPPAPSPSVVQW